MTTQRPSSPRASRAPAASAPSASPRTNKRTQTRTEPAWTDVANFVLAYERRAAGEGGCEYRITAHRMQEDGLTAEWQGVDQQAMWRWVSDHLDDWPDRSGPGSGDATVPVVAPAIVAPAPPSVPPATPQPTLLWPPQAAPETPAQPPQADASPRSPDGESTCSAPETHRVALSSLRPEVLSEAGARVHAAKPSGLALQVSVSVEPLAVEEVRPSALLCEIDFFARSTATSQKFRLGTATVEVEADRTSRVARMADIALHAGTYRFACVARLRGGVAPVACTQGGLVDVR